jgi:hypothetical protein
MKRVLAVLALLASLSLVASPVMAAETYHWQNSGRGLGAYFTNIDYGLETLPPGDYFETYVDASQYVSDTADTIGDGLCVGSWSFTVDGDGNWTDESWSGACVEATTLTVDKRLGSASVAGTIPVEDCTEWDEDSGECIGDWILLGTFEVDLTLTGVGPLYRHHGAQTGGTAGLYQYTSHGNGTDRAADVAGTVTFEGASVIEEATMSGGSLWSFREGGVDIMVCKPSTGC